MSSDALDIDFSPCYPGPAAAAEPYHAIMKIGADGLADGTIWGQGTRLMLFDDTVAANKILEALGVSDYALRGVTAAHLDVLRKLEDSGRAELFVIVGFTPNGQIEAVPIAEHADRRKRAGNPPPLPKRG